MRGSGSPVADEYNEDTDKANDSEDDQWEDNKLVIDLDPNSSMNSDNNKASAGFQSKDQNKSTGDNFTPPEPKAEKPKGKRGVQRKSEKSDTKETVAASMKSNGKQVKSDKDKPAPNKPGRKRKEKPANPKSTNGDVKSPASVGEGSSPTDPYKFDTEEGISATAAGKHSNKANRTDIPVMKDAQTDYDWRSVGSVTEPEQLAPCEPGTQVCLEGIVWQETNNGVLIVNVTWRGKTYMGTLLDATKHDWSPPSCDSPVAELEGRTPKGRGKRSRVPLSDTFKDFNERKLRKEIRKQSGTTNPPPSPAKSDQGKRRSRNSEGENGEPTSKRGRTTSRNPSVPTSSSSPTLIECPEPNCGKKYKQMNGLRYHQRNAHQDTASHVSDSLSETEKLESVSSPDENKRAKRKSRGENIKSAPVASDSKSSVMKSEPEETENKNSDNTTAMQTNTTSVITSTTTQISNSNQLSNVPVATITPQVIKPSTNGAAAEEPAKSINNQQQTQSSSPATTASTNRSLTSAPKFFPKSSSNSMAPISTITSQGVYNPSLKPIQPKPTILGESTPNPTLTDLRDQKKLKRRRSASRDDLTNGNSSPYSDPLKPSFKTELEGKPSGQFVSTALQSPSYSDISEEGEIRNARREMLSNNKMDLMCPPPAIYPIATVSPQKNIPVGMERSKPSSHQNHSPASKAVAEEKSRRDVDLEFKQREMEMLKQYGQYQQQQRPSWTPGITAGMPPDHFIQMQLAIARERERQRRSVSPRPSSIKSSPAPQAKELEAKASSDRLQLLKENKDMKPHGSNLMQQEIVPDLQPLQNPHLRSTEEINKFLMFQQMQQNQQKRESLQVQTHSPAHKPTSNPSKAPEARLDHSRVSRSSPMATQPAGYPPFMSNPLFPFPGMPGIASPMPPGFFPPGFPYAGLPDMKDPTRPGPSSIFSKPDHKIHELEGLRAAKSPRPPSDRPHSAKSHPSMPPHTVFSAYSAAAAAGYNGSGIPGVFQPK